MAIVPYGQRKVQTAALPGVRRTAAETQASQGVGVFEAEARAALVKGQAAAGTANAAARLANQVGSSVEQVTDLIVAERRKADEVQSLANENQLSTWVNKRLYDPQTGALNVKGKDAMPVPEQVFRDFEAFAGEIERGLPNERQKLAFEQQRAQVALNLDGALKRHVFGEMQKYDATETQSAIANNVQAAITNANDPRMVGQSLTKALGAAAGYAKRNGVGPEVAAQQADAIKEQTHTGVIASLIAQDNTKAAAVYFEEVKNAGQLKGEALTKIEKALAEGKARKIAQLEADKIIAAGGSLTSQREKARQIEDADVRDNVMQRIEHESAVQEKAERDRDVLTLRGAYNLIDQSGGDINSIPATVWTSLEGAQRSALRSYANALAKGVPIETDLPTYYSLMQQAAKDPATFLNQNLLNYRAKLDETEFKQLAGLQLAMGQGDTKKVEKELGGFRTNNQILEDALAGYGLDPAAKPTTEGGKAIAQLRRMLDVRVQTQEALTGKKPTNTDIQGMIDGILSQSTKVPGSWWNAFPGGKPFFDQEKRLIDTAIEDVPADERRLVEQALKAKGRPISDATVLDLYLESQARKLK